jgi:hypothetical protein
VSTENTTAPTGLARMAIGLLSLSPFAVALDLWLRFLPDFPAMQYMRTAAPAVQAGWIALGPIGIIAIILLRRRPVAGATLALMFCIAYVPLARLLWRHFTWGCWLAIASAIFVSVGAILWARSNNTSKPA